ncbi:V-type H+-transporting ATPase subunit I [Strigomonas culicis]|uniref:V-type proton ATPase subunit a n=1 Tax=Strigomonas culicis TaxID=28005 RepID=S9WG69_9TRYP|nr:V-type H+-transporting ATPase subunit I [Strigomonas culicis]|eukprot:EPY34725.1 V-type H+-transporting ATPase subunit I [Strigomonas culicis]
MNLCAVSGATCTASVWIPCRYESMLEQALHEAVYASGEVHSIITRHVHQTRPPTYYETNKFTSSFQSIVDSYGMARYKEVNPGVFTIITFPYLFGIMYGDIGHGILLLCISLFFIYKERSWTGQPLNEIIGMIFGGRYLLLLMSLFATYMGFLYNDFFGFSVNIFKSGYTWPSLETRNKSEHTMYPSNPNGLPSVKPPHVYVFGLDVAWAETENKLEFYNSVKMKCAVVVGVTQMFAGVILSLNNHIYNKDWLRIAFLTVPEFLFLLVTFGYMSILIIVKWCTTWESTHDAPSLLETMTNFFLQPTSLSNPLFAGQMGLQIFFLLVALLMVPLMLCGMPVIEYRKYQRYLARQRNGFPHLDVMRNDTAIPAQRTTARQEPVASGYDAQQTEGPQTELVSDGDANLSDAFNDEAVDIIGEQLEGDDKDHEKYADFEFSEVIIHYVIHTIEYVLSSVSNTASYLRLWALSLAHAQLSEVFFNFALVKLLSSDSTGILVGFGVLAWLGATLAVLVGMEALSAFLHALRLHWVEFQNKFYIGDGIPLEPLDLCS